MSTARTRLTALCGVFVVLFVALAPRTERPVRSVAPAPTFDDGTPLPAGAVACLGTAAFRHPADVTALSISPDGATVYTTAGGSAFAWELASGRLKWRADGLKGTAAIREVGDRVRVGPNPTVELGRCSGRVLATWDDVPDAVDLWPEVPLPDRRFLFRRAPKGDPDGRVATTTWDGAGAGAPIQAGGYYGSSTWQRVFSPDGAFVSTRFGYRWLSVYSTASGKRLDAARETDEWVYTYPLSFTPDSSELIAAHEHLGHGTWAVAHPVGGGPGRRLFPPVGETWKGLPEATRISADGRWAAFYFTVGDYWELWDRTAVRPPMIVYTSWAPPGRPWPGEFTPDSSRFVTVCGGRQLVVYDADTASPTTAVPVPFALKLRWTPNGELVAISSRAVVRWEPLTGRRVSWVPFPRGADKEHWFMGVDLSHDGNTALYPTDQRESVARLDVRTGAWRELIAPVHHKLVGAVLSPDGAYAVVGYDGGTRLVATDTGATLRELKPGTFWHGGEFTPDGRWYVAGSHRGGAKKWDTRTWEAHEIMPPNGGRIEHLTCTPDSRTAVALVENWERPPPVAGEFSAFDDSVHTRSLIAWDVNTGRQLCKVPLGRVPSWVANDRPADETAALEDLRPYAIAGLPDGRTVAVGGERDSVYLIDVPTGRLLRAFGVPASADKWSREGNVTALAASPDGRYLASVSSGHILVWNLPATTPSPR